MNTPFEIKTSTIPEAGSGVFVLQDFEADSFLELKPRGKTVGVDRHENDIPPEYLHYCIARENDIWTCPRDFDDMEPVWYLNHSDAPNAELRSDGYYSLIPIRSGEEVLIDYNQFDEPDEKKEMFYRK